MGRRAVAVGTIRVRRHGTNPARRWIKVLSAAGVPYWRSYAVHIYEAHHGPVPPGRHVLHADGDSLNDDPANLIVAAPGDTLLALEEPKTYARWAVKTRAAVGKRNRELARINRAFRVLASEWYLVLPPKRFWWPVPFPTRKALLTALELPAERNARHALVRAGVLPQLGRDVPTEGGARVNSAEIHAALLELLPRIYTRSAPLDGCPSPATIAPVRDEVSCASPRDAKDAEYLEADRRV